MIGDPETRYREDPVRMLRAARFAAKLGFTLHPDTEAPVHKLAYLLDGVPPARLFDETMKLLLAGSAAASCNLLARLGLLAHLMPDLVRAVNEAPGARRARGCVQLGLAGTDERVRADKSVTPTFLFAVLLWPAILREAGVPNGPLPEDPAVLGTACDAIVSRQLRRIAIPKRFTMPMRDIIMMQQRFERRSGRRALALPRASAVPRGLRFPAAARGVGRDRSGARGVVDAPAAVVAGGAHRRGREPAGAGDGRGREAPASAPQASRRSFRLTRAIP